MNIALKNNLLSLVIIRGQNNMQKTNHTTLNSTKNNLKSNCMKMCKNIYISFFLFLLIAVASSSTVASTISPTVMLTTTLNLKNLACDKKITTPFAISPDFSSESAVDCDENTAWGYFGDSPFLLVDLEDEYKIDNITIKWFGPYYSSVYSIAAFTNDGLFVQEIIGNGGTEKHSLSSNDITARYVGMFSTNPVELIGVSEFEVWGENTETSSVRLPELTGAYDVGTTLFPLIDTSRLENFTEDITDDFREVMVQLWYPVNKGTQGESIEYFDAITEEGAISMGFPFDFFKNIKTHAIKEETVATKSNHFPVLLFSPGLGSTYSVNQAFIENVVSHGYIVAGINHPYFASMTSFPDGHWISGAEDVEKLIANFHVIVNDTKFVIKELDRINQPGSGHLLSERMDMEKIGIYGHSIGGAMALEAGIQVPEVKAVIDMDGSLFGNGFLNDIDLPVYFMLQEDHISNIHIGWNNLKNDGYKASIAGALHNDFTDIKLYPKEVLPSDLELGSIEPEKLINFSVSSIIAFFDAYLKDKPKENITNIANQYEEVILEIK